MTRARWSGVRAGLISQASVGIGGNCAEASRIGGRDVDEWGVSADEEDTEVEGRLVVFELED